MNIKRALEIPDFGDNPLGHATDSDHDYKRYEGYISSLKYIFDIDYIT